MLDNARLVAFAAITDSARARAFYENTLGLRFVADEPFALVFDANGSSLRLAKVPALTPTPYTVLGWVVPDVRAGVAALSARGVVFERFEGMPQDELRICSFPDGGSVAWFKDTDGNLLSITQLH